MENQGPLILDISSDEEMGFADVRKEGGGEFGDREDVDWLSKLLVEVGGNIDDDSDDVVFVSELFPKTPKKSRSESLKPLAKVAVDDDGDEDCVVLDGDPDKAIVVVNNKVDVGDDSDDLEIVGEKGEVACRDFPHPRHLCAKHPFTSTSHEVHCVQCHCYVCDSLAPCSHWGTGINSVDHCHASDKYEYWKTERKHVKKSEKPVSDIRSTSGRLESYFQSIQVPGCAPSRPNSLPQNQDFNPATCAPSQPNSSLPQNQDFNPVTLHPCALSSIVSFPNAIHQVRSQPSEYVAPKYNPRSQLVSVQSHPRSTGIVAPNVAFRNNSHHVGSQNPQSFTSRAVFKRNGLIGASTNNRHTYRFQVSRGPPLNRVPAFQAPVTNGCHGSNQQIVGSQAAVSVIPQPGFSSHNMGAGHANYLSSEPQTNSRPYSSLRNPDSIPHQSQTSSLPFVNGNSLSSPPLQPYIYSQRNNSVAPEPYIAFVPNNPVPSQTVVSSQSDAGNTFANQLHSGSTISLHSSLGNDSSQLQEHSNRTSSLTCGQNDVQQHHTQSGTDASSTDFGFVCDTSVNHGNMQIHAEQSPFPSAVPAETSQMQDIPEHDQPSIAPVTVGKLPPQTAFTSPINEADCQFPESKEPGSFDYFFDSWMFENQSFSGAVEASASPIWNVYSPETAFTDTGTLFDI